MDIEKLVEQLLAENKRLKEENAILKEQVKQLQERVAQLEKNSSNSSKPPSSDIVKPPPKMPRKLRRKRRPGGQPGHRKWSRTTFKPDEIDKVVQYEWDTRDAEGLIPLDQWYVLQQVSLPDKMFHVTEHRARKYLDPHTGKIHIATMPDEVRRGGLLAADMSAMIAFLKGDSHMSISSIQRFLEKVLCLNLSHGMISKIIQKTSQSLESAYTALVTQLPNATHIGVDETGHPDQGKLHWTWCFQTPAYSLFHIDGSRSSKVLQALLTGMFNGTLHCDYYSSYRKFKRLNNTLVQYCIAHLIREIRFMAEHPLQRLARWGQDLLAWLKKLFDTLHRADQWTTAGYARRMDGIRRSFLDRVRRPVNHELARNLAARFKGKAAENYFRFLTDPNVEPTNNATERALRHPVIDRRITQGTRGHNGMRWCERIWTTLATCQKQQRNAYHFIHQSLVTYWKDTPQPKLV